MHFFGTKITPQLFRALNVESPMKTTLALIASLALAIPITTSLAEAPAEGSPVKKEGKVRHPFKKLELTDDQKAQMDVIRKDSKAKADVINGNAALSPEQKKEQLKALKAEKRTIMEGVLTPAQMEQMKGFEANHEKKSKTDEAEIAIPQITPAP